MAFNLPAKQVAWNYDLQTRVPFNASLNQTMGDVMFALASKLITTRGFACKGSSNGVVGGMDGVFRWASGNDAKSRFAGANGAQSWVVISLGGGGGDVGFSFNSVGDDRFSFWWSPGGLAVAQSTATFEPTAADRVQVTGYFGINPISMIGTATSGDRILSVWTRPDKRGFRAMFAAGGALWCTLSCEPFTKDQYADGVTLFPNFAHALMCRDFNASGTNGSALMGAPSTTANGFDQFRTVVRRSDGGGAELHVGRKILCKSQGGTGSNAPSAVTPDLNSFADLQGGAAIPMKRIGLYSNVTNHRGDVGWLIDWYAGRSGVLKGETAGALEWICIADALWWPWDGLTNVVLN